MDLPSQRSLIQARIDNLKESQENYENGKLDSYSRRYASIMGGQMSAPMRAAPPIEEKEEHRGAKNLRSPSQ
jgi:hypothetical protein